MPSQEQMREQILQMMGQGAPAKRDDAVEVVVQTGHAAAVTLVALSNDGRAVASGSLDESVKLWDVASGQAVRTFTGSPGIAPTTIAFSADGARLIVCDLESARVYDTSSGAQLFRVLSGGAPAVVSADGRIIAGTTRLGDHHELVVVDVATGDTLWTVPAEPGMEAFALGADGRMLATLRKRVRRTRSDSTAGEPAQIEIWDLTDKARRSRSETPVLRSDEALVGALSADGRLLAFEDGARNVALVDAASGQLLRTLATRVQSSTGSATSPPGSTTTLTFSRDGRSLAWAATGNVAKIWAIDDGRETAAFAASAVGWRADGTVLALGHGEGGAPSLRDAASGSETPLSAGATEANDVALVAGGRALVAAMQDGGARWWDLASGQIVQTFQCPGGGAADTVSVSRPPAGSASGPQSLLALGCADGSASIWDPASGGLRQLILPPIAHEWVPVIVRFTPDGRALVAARQDQVVVWEVSSGKELRRITVPPAQLPASAAQHSYEQQQWVSALAIHPDSQIVAVGQRFALTLWSLSSGELVAPLVGKGSPLAAMMPGGTAMPGGMPMPGGMTLPGGMRFPGGMTNPFEALNEASKTAGAHSAAFSLDGRWLLSVGQQEKQLWDMRTRQEVPAAAPDLRKDPGQMMNLLTGMVGAQSGRGVAFAPGGRLAARGLGHVIKLWEPATGTELGELSGHTSDVTALAFSEDGKRLVSGARDGSVRVWSVPEKKEIVALTALGPRDFVAVTPDQYYRASKARLQGVSFRVGEQLFPFEQFDLRFDRPDLVVERLGVAAPEMAQSLRHAYEHRLKKMGFTQAMLGKDFHMPQIEVLTREVPVSTAAFQLALRVQGRDDQYALDRFMAYVNDVPVFGSGGVPIADHGHLATTDLTVPLAPGRRNKIQISVFNAEGVESLRQTLYTQATGAAAAADLWPVTIGVSHYQNKHYELRYAAKDAADVVSLLTSRYPPGGSAGVAHILELNDEKATREGIRAARAWLQQAKSQDMAVIFVAGHGMTDPQQNYYFGTYDIDAAHPSVNGLPFEEFEKLLDGIAPLKKLLLVDTCFSGEIEKDEPSALTSVAGAGSVTMRAFSAMRGISVQRDDSAGSSPPSSAVPVYAKSQQEWFADLRRGTGAAVISSASGNEYALEGEQWHNGVFTYAVLVGLKNGKADRNGDGVVTVSELEAFVIDAVRTLTKGQQNPTVRRENLDYDFPVY
jgi:WD40 repeat protein